MSTFQERIGDLETAEDFLTFFQVPFEDRVVRVNRLHILQRIHDYMAKAPADGEDGETAEERMRDAVAKAYQDFVSSDALTERVFKVLKDGDPARQAPQQSFVPLDLIAGVKKPPTSSG